MEWGGLFFELRVFAKLSFIHIVLVTAGLALLLCSLSAPPTFFSLSPLFVSAFLDGFSDGESERWGSLVMGPTFGGFPLCSDTHTINSREARGGGRRIEGGRREEERGEWCEAWQTLEITSQLCLQFSLSVLFSTFSRN